MDRRSFLALAGGLLAAEPLRVYSFLWSNPLAASGRVTVSELRAHLERQLGRWVAEGFIVPPVSSRMVGDRIVAAVQWPPLLHLPGISARDI